MQNSNMDIENRLRVLITNTSLANRTGSELFVRDIAFELLRRGHTPLVYSPRLGELAEELRVATIPVVDDLNKMTITPHIIHGHHHLETMTALAHFSEVPAVYFCHGILPWQERPPHHPRITRYIAISETIREYMTSEYGISGERITRFSNFVDMNKFKPRQTPLPAKPQKALIFSNYASENNYVGIVREACERHGITLDVIGLGTGTATATPETVLVNYDIIFARGRAALESIAVGAALICCDLEGIGSMLSSGNLDWYRLNNFGLRTLNRRITPDVLFEEIAKYDSLDTAKISQKIRKSADLISAVDHILEIYRDSIQTWTLNAINENTKILETRAIANYLRWTGESAYFKLPHENQRLLLEIKTVQEELHAINNLYKSLQSELSNIKNTWSWRFREYLINCYPIYNIYRIVAAIIKRFQVKKK